MLFAANPTPTPGPYPPALPPHPPATFGDWVWSIVANFWEWVAHHPTLVAALAAVATAVIAIWSIRAAARDSRERSRPVILAELREAPNADRVLDFVVRNYGSSAARAIDVKFDPPFGDEAREDRLTAILAERYDARIALLPPGGEIANLWWTGRPAAGNTLTNGLKTPDRATVTITYKGNRFRRYKDVIEIDVEWKRHNSYSVSSSSMPGRMKTIAESLTKIAAESREARMELRDIGEVLGTPEMGDFPPRAGTINFLRALSAAGYLPPLPTEDPDDDDDGLPSTENVMQTLGGAGFFGPNPGGAVPATPGTVIESDAEPAIDAEPKEPKD